MHLVRRISLLPVLVGLTLALATAACGRLAGTGQPAAPSQPGQATVTRVVDGDTVIVHIGSKNESVRLLGIDTPESVKPGTPVQCFALEASARTKALLPPGTPVHLEGDVDGRDRYGRLLAYVYRLRDDLFVNAALVEEGFAVPYTIPPNVAHADRFAADGATARRGGLGLWGRCGADIPHHGSSEGPAPLPSPP